MNVAYAANGAVRSQFMSLLPLLFLGLILGFLFKTIAKRKGRNEWLWFLAGFVPGWNLIGGLWLASLPDKSIVEDVKALLSKLRKVDFVPRVVQDPYKSAEPRTWKCNCGITNDMNVLSCPQCGIKIDYLLRQPDHT